MKFSITKRVEMNITIIRSLLFALAISQSAYGKECIKGDCDNGIGQIALSNGSYFFGEFKEGRSHGYGIVTYRSGTVCEGYSRRSIWHGLRHCYYSPSGKRFFGNYNSGKRSAEGITIDALGEIETEGFYFKGKLQRRYEIDRERLLERLLEMRMTANAETLSALPVHMKVFYMPTKGQVKLAEAPMRGELRKRQEMLVLQVGINNESDGNDESATNSELTPTGDVFAPSKLVTNSNADLQQNKTSKTKQNNNSTDESTLWATSICTEEGFRSGTSEFATCVAKMRLVY